MARYGAQFGPDITFLGVDRCDWADAGQLCRRRRGDPRRAVRRRHLAPLRHPVRPAVHPADLLPAARRLAGRRWRCGSTACATCGSSTPATSRCSPATPQRSVRDLQAAVYAVTATGAIPLVLGGDHTIAWPDAAGVAQHLGQGRISMIHFDAHADTGDIEFGSLIGHGQPMRRLIESGALRGDRFLQIGLRGYWPAAGDAGLDGRAGHALLRDDRDRRARPDRVPDRGVRDRAGRLRRGVPVGRHRRLRPGPRAGHRHPRAGRPDRAATARRGAADLLRAAGGRDGRGRGVAALRPRRDHRVPGQPGGAGGAVRHRPPAPGRRRRHAPGIPGNPCWTAANRFRRKEIR